MTPTAAPHIGVLTTSYPRFDGDHAGIFVARATAALRARGLRATVVAPRDRDHRRAPAAAAAEVRVVEAPVPRDVFYGPGVPERLASGAPGLSWRVPLAVAGLGVAGATALRGCDALIGHWLLPTGPLCAMLAAGRPWGVVAHSGGARMLLRAPRAAQALARAGLRGARFVTASEPGLAAALADVLDREVAVVGPHSGSPALWGLPARPTSPGDPIRLGFLGRRVPIKGLDRLMAACDRAHAAGAPLELTIAGPGASSWRRPWLRDLGEERGDAQLQRFMASIDVLVVPSRASTPRAEGLPCVVMEAWAAGRAVLSTDSGGLRHHVPEAWQVPADIEPEGLAHRLAALTRPQLTEEGAAARARAHQLETTWRATEQAAIDSLLHDVRHPSSSHVHREPPDP